MEETIVGYEHNGLGKIRIAPEVVGIIAGLAAAEVDGVTGMSTGVVGDLVERFGRRKNPSRGVQVEVGEKEAAVDVSVMVEYGRSIRAVAEDIQQSVKRAIESMTGLNVVEVNVHVVDVTFQKETDGTDHEEREETKSVRVR